MRITVVGTGYLGAVHAACLADLGFEVLGVDTDAAKIETLSAGTVPFYEPGLPEVLNRGITSGKLHFTTSAEDGAAFGDVIFLCIGTPQRSDGYAADLSYLETAVAALTPHLDRPVLVVGKSTVPVGTAARLAQHLAAAPGGDQVELAWNPEFLREGFAVEDTLHPDRLVFGVRSERAEQTLRTTYATPISAGTPVVVTDFATAELVKVAANAFLATKISFINAMAEVCEATGADVTQLATALGYDERIGRRFLQAGLGFGGGCLPKDIRAFLARAEELGVPEALEFLRDIDSINLRRRTRTIVAATELVGGTLTDRRIACLGAAFKPDSDDVRDSPALYVASALAAAGAEVRVTDPKANDNAKRRYPELAYVDNAFEAAASADAVLLLTEWQDFRDLDPIALAEVVSQPRILDARNVLNPAQWREAGWMVRSLGRP